MAEGRRPMATSSMLMSLRIGHRRYVLVNGVNSVGREPECVVCISDSSVSRQHARITISGTEAVLEDLHSKNGTKVMGEPAQKPTLLHDGDEVEFGHVKGWFIVEAGDDPPTTTGREHV